MGFLKKNKKEEERVSSGFEVKKQFDWIRGELEFHHQNENLQMRANPDKSITLGNLLNIIDISKDEIGNMYVVSNYNKMQGQLIQDLEQIWNYDLFSDILVKLDEKISTKFSERVILTICYRQKRNESDIESFYDKYQETNDLIIVHLSDSGNFLGRAIEKETYYICATVCIPPFSFDKQKIPVTDYRRLQGEILSITFAYDTRNSEQKIAEYRYIQQDAFDKIKNNRSDELSDIQRFFVENIREIVGKDFYFGKKSMEENCYGNAINYFLNIYEYLNSEWQSGELSKEEKYYFFESCYCLGYCYSEIKLYEKAFYYLDIVWHIDDVNYKVEYINCLVNKNDFRALHIISSEIDRISDIAQNAAKLSDGYEWYYKFLMRRLVYIYVQIGKLDEAETMLKNMLNEDQDEDFVLNELAYIQQIRNQEEK